MATLIWGTAGERLYEAGADRGVLYLPGVPGVAWNGLKAVNESPTGGDPQPYYVDGYKYINLAADEEFVATIEALSSPPEFAECDGTVSISNGLFVAQQPRTHFDLCYRTKVGNDLLGLDHGYKLHLVYGALATPSSRSNTTLSDDPDVLILSWGITTAPPLATGYKPTSHMIVDSTKTNPEILSDLEDILYGSDALSPHMPTQADLIALFS